jgi:hypothetical protein
LTWGTTERVALGCRKRFAVQFQGQPQLAQELWVWVVGALIRDRDMYVRHRSGYRQH